MILGVNPIMLFFAFFVLDRDARLSRAQDALERLPLRWVFVAKNSIQEKSVHEQ